MQRPNPLSHRLKRRFPSGYWFVLGGYMYFTVRSSNSEIFITTLFIRSSGDDRARPYVWLRVACYRGVRRIVGPYVLQGGRSRAVRRGCARLWHLAVGESAGDCWAGHAIRARDVCSFGRVSAGAARRLGEEEREQKPVKGDRGVSRRCSFCCHWVRPFHSRVRTCA